MEDSGMGSRRSSSRGSRCDKKCDNDQESSKECDSCKKQKRSYEIKELCNMKPEIVEIAKRKKNLNDSAKICNACKTAFSRKVQDETYTPKKERKKERGSCVVPMCRDKAFHDLHISTLEDDHRVLYDCLGVPEDETASNVPLCRAHHAEYHTLKRKMNCSVCKSSLWGTKKRYKLQEDEVARCNVQLDKDGISEHITSTCVLCSICYQRLSRSCTWQLNQLSDKISIPVVSEINIPEVAAAKTAHFVLDKFRLDRAVLLADAYDYYLSCVDEQCKELGNLSLKPDSSKTSRWLLMYLRGEINDSILHLHSLHAKKFGTMLVSTNTDTMVPLHHALVDLRKRDDKTQEKLDVLEAENQRHRTEVSSCDTAYLYEACLKLNEKIIENIARIAKKYDALNKDIVSKLENLSVPELLEDIDPTVWNVLMLLTMNKTERSALRKDANFSWDCHYTDFLVDDDSDFHKVRLLRKIFLSFTIFLNADRNCTYPLHILLSDLVHAHSGSTVLVRTLNRLGICASSASLGRYTAAMVDHTDEGQQQRRLSSSPLFMSIDNLDWLFANANVTTSGKLSHHVTTVQGTQSLPTSDIFEGEEGPFPSEFSILHADGDGRCLFRCVASFGDPVLRHAARSETGLPLIPSLAAHEQYLADTIRSIVVDTLKENRESVSLICQNMPYLMGDTENDKYSSLSERLEDMEKWNQYAGTLEIMALAFLSKNQFFIYEEHEEDGQYILVSKVPAHHYQNSKPVCLLYTPDQAGQPGHYDLMLEKDVHIGNLLDYKKNGVDIFSPWACQPENISGMTVPLIELFTLEDASPDDGSLLEHSYALTPSADQDLKRQRQTHNLSNKKGKPRKRLKYEPDNFDQDVTPKMNRFRGLECEATLEQFNTLTLDEKSAMTILGKKLMTFVLERHVNTDEELGIILPGLKCKLAMEQDNYCQKSVFVYLHVVNKPADNLHTVRSVLENLASEFHVGSQVKYLVIIGDGKTFDYLLKLKLEYGAALDWVIPYLGDWHLLKNMQPVIMAVFWSAGLKEIAKKTHQGAALLGLARCYSFRRTHKFLLQVWEAIYRCLVDSFLKNRMVCETSHCPLQTEQIIGIISECLGELDGVEGRMFEDIQHYSSFLTCQADMETKLEGLEEDFQQFVDNLVATNKTARLWCKFIFEDMMAYISLWIAMRSGNWFLRMAAIKRLLPLVHAFDRPMYSRLLPWHIAHMLNLPPPILAYFKQGGFVASIKGIDYSRFGLDEVHEAKINRDVKNVTHTLVPSRTPTFDLFCRFLPLRASILANLKNQILPQNEVGPILQKGYASKDIKKVEQNVRVYNKKYSEENVFQNSECPLRQLFCPNIVTAKPEQEKDMLEYSEIGKESSDHYIKTHILQIPSTKPPQRRKNLKTFAPPKVTKSKLKRMEKYTRDQLESYKLVCEYSKQNKTEITEDQIGQIWDVPLALALPDSQLPYKGTKSSVKQFYDRRYPQVIQATYPENWRPNVVILEGMNMIYSAPFRNYQRTFLHYVHHLTQRYITRHIMTDRVQEVHVLFDSTAPKLSPKVIEQSRRDGIHAMPNEEDDNSEYQVLDDNTKLPSNWSCFLKNRSNKVKLCKYLGEAFLRVVPFYMVYSYQKIVTAGSESDGCAFSATKEGTVTEEQSLRADHDEADTLIFVHVSQSTFDNILIYSKDVDVIHIGLPVVCYGKRVVIQTKKQTGEDQFMDLTTLQTAIMMDPDMGHVEDDLRLKTVQTIFICTGCDYVSYFKGHGKVAFLQTFAKHSDFISGSSNIAREYGTLADTQVVNKSSGLMAFYRLVGCRYFDEHSAAFLRENIQSPEALFQSLLGDENANIEDVHTAFLAKIREKVFSKCVFEYDHLPASDALAYHWDRSVWTSIMWNSCCNQSLEMLPVEEFHWKVNNNGTSMEVVWHSQEQRQIVNTRRSFFKDSCKCGTSKTVKSKEGPFCKNNMCKCKKGGKYCGPLCKCRCCQNINGQEEQVEQDVELEDDEPHRDAHLDAYFEELTDSDSDADSTTAEEEEQLPVMSESEDSEGD